MALSAWPTITDDSGTNADGTILNRALFDLIRASIEGDLYGVSAPSRTPGNTTDEVIAARGSKTTLDARLDVALNEDGTLKTIAGAATVDNISTQLGQANLMHDSLLMLWPDGDTSAPSGWTLSGAGAAIVRTGTGGGGYEASAPGDATKMKFGKFAAKITRGSADAKLIKTVVSASRFPTGLQGRKVSVIVRAKTSVASQASLIVDDGVTTTRGGQGGNGTYHTGGGAEELLYATHTLSGSATKIDLQLEVAGSGAAYFGNIVVVVSDVVPKDWFPERWGYLLIGQQSRGNCAAANLQNEFRHVFETPAFMVDTRLKCKTAPATQAIIVRPAKTSATYPYSTNPSIAAGATTGNKVPEGTYANRCFKQDDIFVWDITQCGTGTVGDEINTTFAFVVSMPALDLLGF